MKTKKKYKVSVRKREKPDVMSRTVIQSSIHENYKSALADFKDIISHYELTYSNHESAADPDVLRIYSEDKKILILMEEII